MTDTGSPPDAPAPVLLVSDSDHVRTLTLNRPDAANAFNEKLYHEVANALHAAADDDGVSVVIITGAGRTFCGGTDLKEMANAVPEEGGAGADEMGDDALASSSSSHDEAGPGPDSSRGFGSFIEALSTFPKPVIAAVNGAGVGVGLTMLAHCDLVFVSDRARLLAPFTAMGVAPEAGSSYLLPRRIGRQLAAYYLFAAEWIDADAAVAIGLALKRCAADTLLDEATAMARQIASKSLPSLMATKRLLREPEREGLLTALEQESETFAELLRLPGARDGVERQLRKDS